MTKQISLFELPSEAEEDRERPLLEALAEIAWSYSRRSTMEQCVRRYYYEYFGASRRTAVEEADKETLRVLKRLQNRHLRTGEILHLVIGTYLRKAQAGNVWKADRLVDWARDLFHKDIAYCQAHPDGEDSPSEKYPPALLSEFYYHDPEATEKCQQAEERLVQALNAFATNPRYHLFHSGGALPDAVIEKLFKLRDILPCRMEGRIDLAYQSEGIVTVVDWKLGVEDGTGDDSLQLAAYALWAVGQYRCAPESLRICKVHLGSGAIVDFHCDRALLTVARARIIQDAERMLFLNTYGQNAAVEAFTPCLQPAICRLCPFVKVCPEGKELVYA